MNHETLRNAIRNNPESLSVLQRMQRQYPATAATVDELDSVVNQLLVPLFDRHGVDTTVTKDDDGWTLKLRRR